MPGDILSLCHDPGRALRSLLSDLYRLWVHLVHMGGIFDVVTKCLVGGGLEFPTSFGFGLEHCCDVSGILVVRYRIGKTYRMSTLQGSCRMFRGIGNR